MSAIEVKVPDIGDFDTVPVIGIMVSVGDMIAEDDPLIELESDKATMEVPAPQGGKVVEIKISEGDEIGEGAVILMLEADGASDAPTPAEAPKEEPKTEAAAPAPAASSAPKSGELTKVDEGGFAKAHASPSVRAFARQMGVDLTTISGTGRKGRILREDITAAFKKTAAPAGVASAEGGMGIPPIPAVDFTKFGAVEDVEMSRIKKISGPALHRSWLNIPHVTHNEEADITSSRRLSQTVGYSGKRGRLSRHAAEFCDQGGSLCPENALGGELFYPSRRRQADPQILLPYRLCGGHAERPDGSGDQERRRQRDRRDIQGTRRIVSQGS